MAHDDYDGAYGLDRCEHCGSRYALKNGHKCKAHYKRGDRVRVRPKDKELVSYLQQEELNGTVVRHCAGDLVLVELDGTGTQDSEGYNMTAKIGISEMEHLVKEKEIVRKPKVVAEEPEVRLADLHIDLIDDHAPVSEFLDNFDDYGKKVKLHGLKQIVTQLVKRHDRDRK